MKVGDVVYRCDCDCGDLNDGDNKEPLRIGNLVVAYVCVAIEEGTPWFVASDGRFCEEGREDSLYVAYGMQSEMPFCDTPQDALAAMLERERAHLNTMGGIVEELTRLLDDTFDEHGQPIGK